MPSRDLDETRASARLPNLDIDIVHRRSPDGEAEQILITLQAMPSFHAFGQVLEAGNPFAFWAKLAETAWIPWLAAMQAWSSLPRPTIGKALGARHPWLEWPGSGEGSSER